MVYIVYKIIFWATICIKMINYNANYLLKMYRYLYWYPRYFIDIYVFLGMSYYTFNVKVEKKWIILIFSFVFLTFHSKLYSVDLKIFGKY